MTNLGTVTNNNNNNNNNSNNWTTTPAWTINPLEQTHPSTTTTSTFLFSVLTNPLSEYFQLSWMYHCIFVHKNTLMFVYWGLQAICESNVYSFTNNIMASEPFLNQNKIFAISNLRVNFIKGICFLWQMLHCIVAHVSLSIFIK